MSHIPDRKVDYPRTNTTVTGHNGHRDTQHRKNDFIRQVTDTKVASITAHFPENNDWVEIYRRRHDDLPAHVLGVAYWHQAEIYGVLDRRPGYRAQINRVFHYIEFVNHSWHILEKQGDEFVTRNSLRIACENTYNLGWWNGTDEENPERRTTPTVLPDPEPIHIDEEVVDPIDELADTFQALPPISVPTGLTNSDDEEPAAQPVSATLPVFPTYATATIVAPPPPIRPLTPVTPVILMAAPPPLTGSLKGITPTIFAGDREKSKQFLRKFRQYKRNNRTLKIMTTPYARVGLALSLIRGPTIDDWVDGREAALDDALTRAPVPLTEASEALWTEFETAFKSVWTDTMSEQVTFISDSQ
ncbi:hypothetical protein EDB85DRAFT_1903063 [Lactarius pseudohatsudake]|nr:hypothetical protein EDB85DRAFT_1903063 [Lactarius pseudohatsudake]